MNIKHTRYVSALLILSAILLASLIPGGPIENRDFSHIHIGVLAGFNIFLTALNLGTFALTIAVIKQRSWAYTAVFIAALSYFIVYAIDLAQVFPRSPTPMSQALSLIEVLGMCAAVPLMYLSWPYTPFSSKSSLRQERDVIGDDSEAESTPKIGFLAALMAVAVALGVGIIFFATDSAMNPATGAVFLAQ